MNKWNPLSTTCTGWRLSLEIALAYLLALGVASIFWGDGCFMQRLTITVLIVTALSLLVSIVDITYRDILAIKARRYARKMEQRDN